jgi:hypothetical protein
MRARTRWLASVAVMLGVAGCSGSSTSSTGPSQTPSASAALHLAGSDLSIALRVGHSEAARATGTPSSGVAWPRGVTSVSALSRAGTLTDSNTGHPCTSGALLVVTVIGRFPRIAVSPPPGATDTTVHAVVATADARTGQVCLRSVRTGRVTPSAGAAVLFRR